MEKVKVSIKNWAEEDRPREKLTRNGVGSLSDAELLAILIGSGNTDESAVELCRRILNNSDNDLNKLGKLSVHDLVKNFKGIGPAKAISIVSALELGKRRKSTESKERIQVTSSQIIFDLFHPMLCDLNHEEMWVLLLDRANKFIAKSLISRGGISATLVDIRLILREALTRYASSIVLVHNHPSGNCVPSPEDKRITKKLQEASQWMDISLLDHLIISNNNYYSFADNGQI